MATAIGRYNTYNNKYKTPTLYLKDLLNKLCNVVFKNLTIYYD